MLPQQGLGQNRSGNRTWCILALYLTSGGISFTDFTENQFTFTKVAIIST